MCGNVAQNLGQNTLEMPFSYRNVVLGKDGEDQLDRSCEKVLHRV